MRGPRVAGEIFREHGQFAKHGTKNMIACDSTPGVPAIPPPEEERKSSYNIYVSVHSLLFLHLSW